jgi:uncharacterized BrkB/YihY/UPF0761 family membrane protein
MIDFHILNFIYLLLFGWIVIILIIKVQPNNQLIKIKK